MLCRKEGRIEQDEGRNNPCELIVFHNIVYKGTEFVPTLTAPVLLASYLAADDVLADLRARVLLAFLQRGQLFFVVFVFLFLMLFFDDQLLMFENFLLLFGISVFLLLIDLVQAFRKLV